MDCGGNCARCAQGDRCDTNADCISTFCDANDTCSAFACSNNAQRIGWSSRTRCGGHECPLQRNDKWNGTRVGGLVGSVANGAMVSTSSSTVTITGTGQRHFGGLVVLMAGGARGTNSHTAGAINVVTIPLGGSYSGLVGTVRSSIVANSVATGNVTSTTSEVGGLVGSLEDSGTGVINSFATGGVTCNSDDNRCGPIVGRQGTLSNAYYNRACTCATTPFAILIHKG